MGYMCGALDFVRDGESLAIVGVRFVRRGDGVGSASCAIDETTTATSLASVAAMAQRGARLRGLRRRVGGVEGFGHGGCGCWVRRVTTAFEEQKAHLAQTTQAKESSSDSGSAAAATGGGEAGRGTTGAARNEGGACRSWTTGTTRLCTTQSSSHARFTTGAPLAGGAAAQTSASTCVAASGATTVAP